MQTKKKKMTAMVDSIRMILRSFSVNGLETKGLSFFMSRANCLIITHIRFNFIFMWLICQLVNSSTQMYLSLASLTDYIYNIYIVSQKVFANSTLQSSFTFVSIGKNDELTS